MSFSLEVKKELSKLNTLADKKNVKTELLGYMATNNVSVQKNKIKFSTESEYNINRFGKLLNNLGLNDHNIKIQRSVYSITINKNYIEELTENNNDNKSDDLEKAFIRGAFLGSGTINNPEKKYHLEISLRNLESAKYILEILKKYNIDFKILEKELSEYFDGKRKEFTVSLAPVGTDFQKNVWEVLRKIPYGTTKSYMEQAKILGNPKAVRAVANANGLNKISIIIPCHRVIGTNGKLTGYGGGIWRKQKLLELEKAILF